MEKSIYLIFLKCQNHLVLMKMQRNVESGGCDMLKKTFFMMPIESHLSIPCMKLEK